MATKSVQALMPVETFARDPAIHAAVCAANGWADGKEVTAGEYESAKRAFLNAPAGAYRRKKK